MSEEDDEGRRGVSVVIVVFLVGSYLEGFCFKGVKGMAMAMAMAMDQRY